jgi:hypothetical protein
MLSCIVLQSFRADFRNELGCTGNQYGGYWKRFGFSSLAYCPIVFIVLVGIHLRPL